ncbi:MAG: hypothetical protein ACLGI3_11875, partial [Actinomycetes bacterium]
MGGSTRGGRSDGPRRRPVLAIGVAVVLLLPGCSSAGDGAPAPMTGGREARAGGSPPPPVPATTGAATGTAGPGITVDLAAGGGPSARGLDVVGTPDGGAVALLGEALPATATRAVRVSPEGEPGVPLAVPAFAPAWNVHALPDGTIVVTGRLLDEDAVGYAVLDPATGAARTVAAVPLDRATHDVVGDSAVSPDGRTMWLYSGMLVDGTYAYLLTGHDLRTGGTVAARDLFGELRATHAADQRLDVVGLTGTRAGTVILAVNAFRPRHAPFWSPMLLVYDTALDPRPGPVELAGAGARVTATALAMAADGTALVLLRGWPVSTLVALPPGAQAPEPHLEMSGSGAADELVI